MKPKKIIIIGSGFGGLSSAALLAKDGHDVTVIEKNEQPGGRASVLEKKGYRFDMGPSWYMMPEVFETFFAEFGKKASDFYALQQLTPQYRVFFDDKSYVDMTGNVAEDRATFEKMEKGAGAKFDQYLKESELKYDLSMKSVLYKNIDSVFDLIDPSLAKYGSALGIFESMQQYIKRFFKNHRIQQILEYNLVFLGCSPHNAPAIFSLMAHVDFNLKVWYPEGGIASIVNAMVNLGKEHNVKYIYNEPVTQLMTTGNKITGVKTTKKTYTADIVISNADYVFTEDLLSDQSLRTFSKVSWNKKVMTPSAFLIYLGVKKKLPKLLHHTLYFGKDWTGHFQDVFDHPRWPVTPSIYINKTSATDSTVAPKGHENLMILVPIAAGLEENAEWKQNYATYIIKYLEQALGMEIEKHIDFQEIFSVSDFSSRYNSYKGNGLGGLAHTFFQSAAWRPKNKSKNISNLYFAGAGTNPGIGVPTSIISGHLVRDKIRKL